jgi:hypothetical protein
MPVVVVDLEKISGHREPGALAAAATAVQQPEDREQPILEAVAVVEAVQVARAGLAGLV